MDIATFLLTGAALVGLGFMGGALFTDRRDRKQALTRLEEGEQRIRSAAAADRETVANLVKTINEAHNHLVHNAAAIGKRVESLETQRAMQSGKAPGAPAKSFESLFGPKPTG